MNILTEESLRSMKLPASQRELVVAPETVCTPSALDFLAARNITLVVSNTAPEKRGGAKPEYKTHLRGDILVAKTHPVIAFRGEMDCLFALIAENIAMPSRREQLRQELSELLDFARKILLCEVTQKPFELSALLGRDLDEYRKMSHNPKNFFGIDHPIPNEKMNAAALCLNTMRAQTRRAELAAVRAFCPGTDNVREDIITALNRLSSVVYVLFCMELAT
ncbi:MAG: hypothetical protein FWG82_00550 [Oscillospiraceae bacterium]|nr:hypothetical protein [Oscillospiraceae bacterium]